MSELINPQTFKVKILKQDLEQIVKLSGLMVEDITLNFDNEGLTIRTMDPSHVALLDIAIPNSLFEKYEIDQDTQVGIRIDEILKIVKEFSKDDSITLTIKDNNLIMANKELSYSVRLIESTVSDCPLPKIPYDSMISLYGNDIKKYLSKLNAVSSYYTISVDNNKCVLETKGDVGNCSINLEKGMDQVIDIKSNDFNRTTYSLEYCIPYFKAMLSNYLHTLEFSGNKPLRVVSKIFNIGRVHFYLAPRVEN